MTANPLSTIPPLGPTTGQGPTPGAARFKPLDPVKLLRANSLLLAVTAMIGLAVGLGSFVILRTQAPQYASNAKLEVSLGAQSGLDPELGGSGRSDSASLNNMVSTEIQRITSEQMALGIVARPRVQNTSWYRDIDDLEVAARDLITKRLRVTGSSGAVITLVVTLPSREDAQLILGEVLDEYLLRLAKLTAVDSEQLRRVFIEERERAAQDIELYNQRIERFRRQHNLPTLNTRELDLGKKFDLMNTSKINYELTIGSAESALEKLLEAQKAGWGTPGSDRYHELESRIEIARIDSNISNLRQQRQVMMRGGIGEGHRTIDTIDRQIGAAQDERESKIQELYIKGQEARVESSRQNLESLRQQLADLQPELEEASNALTDVQSLLNQYRDLERLKEEASRRRDITTRSLDELRLLQDRPDAINVSQLASPTKARIAKPDPKVVLPSGLVGFLGVICLLVFLKELLDQRIKSPADIQLLRDATLLGVIPDADEDPFGEHEMKRIVERHPTGLLAESFRQVRTALLNKMDRRGYKTLLVVSAQPGSGTTTVAQNLAASLAYNGRRVLLLDTNMRRPEMAGLCGVPQGPGLFDLLQDPSLTLEQGVHRVSDLTLWVMPAGACQHGTPEQFEGPAFRGLLAKLEAEYDFVLIDVAPSLLTTEARLMTKLIDAVALVVHAGTDKRGMVDRMAGQLDGHRADILGIILNGVQTSAGGYFRKNYEAYYRYSQTDRKTARGKANDSTEDRLANGRMMDPPESDRDTQALADAIATTPEPADAETNGTANGSSHTDGSDAPKHD